MCPGELASGITLIVYTTNAISAGVRLDDMVYGRLQITLRALLLTWRMALSALGMWEPWPSALRRMSAGMATTPMTSSLAGNSSSPTARCSSCHSLHEF